MKIINKILLLLLFLVSLNVAAQVKRLGIQDYASVVALQAETLVPKVNDKVYVSTLKTLFTWESTNISVENSQTVIKQANIATGRWVSIGATGSQNVAITYGRVNASTALATTLYVNTVPGTKIPFSNVIYSSGMTLSGTDGIVPTVSGHYRASWLMMAGSEQMADNGYFHVVQNGVSVGQVLYNMMEASGVNQCAGFIDVDLVAGQTVNLYYRSTNGAGDNINWDAGSYFDLTQVSNYLPVSPTAQPLTWGQNYWAAQSSMTGAVSTFPYVASVTRQTLAPTAQRLPLSSGTFTGSGITRDNTNNRLIVLQSGRYQISADIISSTGGNSPENGIQLIQNGTTILTMNTKLATATYLGANLFWEGDLVANDYVELRAWVQGSTGTFYLDGGTFNVSQQPTSVSPAITDIFIGATSTTNGTSGSVPIAVAGQEDNVLKGDGTWGTGKAKLSDIIAATEVSTITNANYQQNWNWNLAGANHGLNISEGVAQAGGAGATLLRVGTLATSTIKPFSVLAQGNTIIDVASTGVTTIGNATGTTSNAISAGATGTTVFNQNGLEKMRVHSNGNVGFGTAAPSSNLHLVGSVAMATTSTSAAAYTLLSTDNTVFLNLAGTQTITLPAASSFSGRIMTFINTAANFKTISAYTTKFGVTNTTIYNRKTLIIQSDGTVWREVGGDNDEATLSNTITSVVIGGVTFSTTWADPVVLTTSGNATGYFKADIVQYSINQTHDYWLTASSGTGGMIVRGGSASGTTRSIGIWNSGFSCNGSGILSVGGFDYQITVATAGTTYGKVSIKILN